MLLAIERSPRAVWVAKHKLWPASTAREDWVWGFGPWRDGCPVMQQQPEWHPKWFAMGLTYTPGRLMDLAAPHMFAWVYGECDMRLSQLARDNSIPIMVAARSQPKHLHFYPREGDWGWRDSPEAGLHATR